MLLFSIFTKYKIVLLCYISDTVIEPKRAFKQIHIKRLHETVEVNVIASEWAQDKNGWKSRPSDMSRRQYFRLISTRPDSSTARTHWTFSKTIGHAPHNLSR